MLHAPAAPKCPVIDLSSCIANWHRMPANDAILTPLVSGQIAKRRFDGAEALI